jgi:hypothetical protein
MSTLVSDLIQQAFLDIDEIRVGRLISTPEQTDSFMRLNQMLAQWSREELSVYNTFHDGPLTLTAGVVNYTFGTVGASLTSSALPIRVTGASSVSGAFTSPVEVISYAEFTSRVENGRGRATVLAKLLAADGSYPVISLRVYPAPAASPGGLWLDYWAAFTQFANVGVTLSMPPGFERALHLNLAVELFPYYARHARPGAFEILAAQAQQAKKSIVDLNAAILGARGQETGARGQTPAASAPPKAAA